MTYHHPAWQVTTQWVKRDGVAPATPFLSPSSISLGSCLWFMSLPVPPTEDVKRRYLGLEELAARGQGFLSVKQVSQQ